MSRLKHLRTLVLAGLFVALGIVLTVFSIQLPYARVGLGPVPTMLAGLLLGPWVGAAVGFVKDIVAFVINPQGTFFPPITVVQMLYGILPPLLLQLGSKLLGRLTQALKTQLPAFFFAIGLTQVVNGVLLMPAVLSFLLGNNYWHWFTIRLPQQGIHIAIYPVITYILVQALVHSRATDRNNFIGRATPLYRKP